MSLHLGSRIGSYEILAALGAGGMGEVYRALDTRLARDVAIKVLPDAVSADRDRLVRFEKEARTLASLNHPHIAQIYGLERLDGQAGTPSTFIVMELVPGESLADRIRRSSAGPRVHGSRLEARHPRGMAEAGRSGGLPVDEAMRLARQIADALDAAHEKGIVHRDLKPANIMISPEGVAKVLDFGIATVVKGEGPDSSGADLTTMAGTLDGAILGTAPYMSPEQARGETVDKRTDIWAFGCVLYEMLSGRLAFHGTNTADTLAAIVHREPDWTALPTEMPSSVGRVLKRCLEKNPKQRLRDLGDLDFELQPPVGGVAPLTRRVSWLSWTIAGAAIVAAGFLAIDRLTATSSTVSPPVRVEIPPAVTLFDSSGASISPDGRHFVLSGIGPDGSQRFWIRSLDTIETKAIAGTEGEVTINTPAPIWSPDNRFIAYYTAGTLRKIERTGGIPETVCVVPGAAVGGSWHRNGVIVVGNALGGLTRCPANGGRADPVTVADPNDRGSRHLGPRFLPDGRHVLYLKVSQSRPEENGLYLADLEAPPDAQPTARLVSTSFMGAYVPAADGPGHVIFVRDQTAFAQRFDPDRLALQGEPLQVAEPIGAFRDGPFLSASADALIYRGATPDYQLTWLDRRGGVLGQVGEPGQYTGLSLSPDARRAVVVRENQLRSDRELWMIDLFRDTSTRFTFDPLQEAAPAWLPDASEVMYVAGPGPSTAVYRKQSDNTRPAAILLQPGSARFRLNAVLATASVTSDARFVAMTVESTGSTKTDIWLVPVAPGAEPVPLVHQELEQSHGRISPDGKWLAYVSNDSGANEVYVSALTVDPTTKLPTAGTKLLVSRGGGTSPRWRGDSQELFYQRAGGTVMAVDMSAAPIGAPHELFRAPGAQTEWDATADGQRFLMALPQTAVPPFTLILNWRSALR
jgi:serine/threonine protein kinase